MDKYIIDRDEDYLRIAHLHKNKLNNLWVQEMDSTPKVGDIFVGRVEKVLSKNNFAFVNIGSERNAFLSLDKACSNIKSGELIIVEVVKEQTEDKGAVVTDKFNIPGAYVVLKANDNTISFSGKFNNNTKKEEILSSIHAKDFGLVVRTSAQEVSIEEIEKEINELSEVYNKIEKKGRFSSKIELIYKANELVKKTLKNIVNENAELIVNNNEDYNICKEFLDEYGINNLVLKTFEENIGVFKAFDLENDVLSLLEKKVPLECGGDLIINKSVAIASIDVNSGKNIKGKNREEIAFQTNIEAAKECGKQIRLRNLSGVIVVDFINMNKREHNIKVKEQLQREMDRDINKSTVYTPTELNLLEITRRRQGNDIYETLMEKIEGRFYSIERIKTKYLIKLIKDILNEELEKGLKKYSLNINSIYMGENIENLKKDILAKVNREVEINITFKEDVQLFEIKGINF